MHPQLRPLSFGELLDGAFTLYRRNFLRFFGTSLVFGLGMLMVVMVVGVRGGAVVTILGGFMGVVGTLLMAAGIAGAVMAVWGALTWQAGQAYTGKTAPLGDVLDACMESASRLVGVGIVSFVLLVAALLPGFVVGVPLAGMGQVLPGVLLMLGWGIAAVVLVCGLLFAVLPAVMLEERGPLEAVGRSFQLARGAVGSVAAVMGVALLITMLPGLGMEAVTGGFAELRNPAAAAQEQNVLKDVLGWVLNLLTAPFLASVCVVLYYDRRIRAEALDVQLVTDRLAVAGD